MPIVSYLFNVFAISILVPTPSVLATIFGLLKFFGISEIEPKPPIFLNFLLPLFFGEILDINLTKLSAAFTFTPLFSYVNLCFFISIKYAN